MCGKGSFNVESTAKIAVKTPEGAGYTRQGRCRSGLGLPDGLVSCGTWHRLNNSHF